MIAKSAAHDRTVQVPGIVAEVSTMAEPSFKHASTRVSRTIKAPRTAVYRACLDPDAVASWRAPDNRKGHVHVFDAREGGTFRMSLTYQDTDHSTIGKTSENTDTFHGKFMELVPNEKIVEVIAFESQDPQFAGEMTITTRFIDTDEGTEITMLCQDIPAGIRPDDNEIGCRSSLRNLAALVEQCGGHAF